MLRSMGRRESELRSVSVVIRSRREQFRSVSSGGHGPLSILRIRIHDVCVNELEREGESVGA
jgi:hypothetical protein